MQVFAHFCKLKLLQIFATLVAAANILFHCTCASGITDSSTAVHCVVECMSPATWCSMGVCEWLYFPVVFVVSYMYFLWLLPYREQQAYYDRVFCVCIAFRRSGSVHMRLPPRAVLVALDGAVQTRRSKRAWRVVGAAATDSTRTGRGGV